MSEQSISLSNLPDNNINLDITSENLEQDVPAYVIAKRLSNIAALDRDTIDDIHVAALIDIHGDFTRRICFKTGQTLGNLSRRSISLALATMGEPYAIDLLQRENIRNCAIHWLKTDSEALDKLIELDPKGYFVYAAGFVLAGYSPIADVNTKYHMLAQSNARMEGYIEYKKAEFMWCLEKAFAYDELENVPIENLVRVNEVLRRYLARFQASTLNEHKPKADTFWQMLTIDDDTRDYNGIIEAAVINLSVFETKLREVIRVVDLTETARETIKVNMAERNYSAIARYNEKYKGYANFRGQRRYKDETDSQVMSRFIDETLAEAGVTAESIRHQEYDQNKRLAISGGKLITLSENETVGQTIAGGKRFKLGTFTITKKE